MLPPIGFWFIYSRAPLLQLEIDRNRNFAETETIKMSAEPTTETEIFQSLVAIVCTTMQGKQKLRTRDAICVCVRQTKLRTRDERLEMRMCASNVPPRSFPLWRGKKSVFIKEWACELVNASLANFWKNISIYIIKYKCISFNKQSNLCTTTPFGAQK